jgi:hypothetical protein
MTCTAIENLSADDFKTHFVRDFPYLSNVTWSISSTYNTDDIVYYSVNEKFYKCKNDSVTSVPTTTADWDIHSDSIYNYILDADITKAYNQAVINFACSLFGTDASTELAFYYLWAHYLVIDLKNASGGVSSGGNYPVSSRSVGSVSESYNIPEKYMKNPYYSYIAQSGYGQKYLSLIITRQIGNFKVVGGISLP